VGSASGWDSFHILFPVNRTQYIGLTNTLIIKKPESNFHVTAQGVYLLSLLADGQKVDKSEARLQ
jgi:hypothetical protein